jgi:hypothetical protein
MWGQFSEQNKKRAEGGLLNTLEFLNYFLSPLLEGYKFSFLFHNEPCLAFAMSSNSPISSVDMVFYLSELVLENS